MGQTRRLPSPGLCPGGAAVAQHGASDVPVTVSVFVTVFVIVFVTVFVTVLVMVCLAAGAVCPAVTVSRRAVSVRGTVAVSVCLAGSVTV